MLRIINQNISHNGQQKKTGDHPATIYLFLGKSLHNVDG
jgi:hypothetical protein